jgi:hypothetical protein
MAGLVPAIHDFPLSRNQPLVVKSPLGRNNPRMTKPNR